MVQSAIGCLEVDDSRVPGRKGPVVVAARPEDVQLTASRQGIMQATITSQDRPSPGSSSATIACIR